MKKIYFLMILGFAGICVLGILFAQASLLWFISLASLLIVAGPTLLLSLSTFSPHEIFRFYRIGFLQGAISKTELLNGILYFKALQRYLLVSGVIGTLIGLIIILAQLNHPGIGQGLSVSLMTILYALILYTAVVIPFRTGLEKKYNEMDNAVG